MPQIVRIVKVFYEKIEKGFDKITKNRYNISCTTMEQGIIMLLGLSKIMQKPDSVLPFHTALDLHDLQFGGSFPVQEPVSAEFAAQQSETAQLLVLSENASQALATLYAANANIELLRETTKLP